MDGLVVGDIVTLASGGPPMTVADVLPWGEVFCVWFTPDRRCVGEVFDLRLVRRLPDPISDTPTAPIVAPLPGEAQPTQLAEGTPPLGYETVGDSPTGGVSRPPGAMPGESAVGGGVAGDLPALHAMVDGGAPRAPPVTAPSQDGEPAPPTAAPVRSDS